MAIHRLPRLIGLLAAPLVLALLPSGCRDDRDGPPQVIVIGPEPKLADPRLGPLNPSDALLLQNVAQGLVAFDQGGNIVAGLAERWNVSNDGLSYIFRIAPAQWADGSKVTAEQVARSLRRQLQGSSRNTLARPTRRGRRNRRDDRAGDRNPPQRAAPQLALLARPARNGDRPQRPWDRAIRDGRQVRRRRNPAQARRSSMSKPTTAARKRCCSPANRRTRRSRPSSPARADLVVGGTFADLPIARQVRRPRGALRFDPASGLFGLAPGGRGGVFESEEWRRLLNRAIDRNSFLAALAVPGLTPRATLLEAGLDGISAPAAPAWAAIPINDRRTRLATQAKALIGDGGPLEIRVFLPRGLGGDVLFRQLELDWSVLGLKVVRASRADRADYVLIDEVAPSASPAWFARRFRCGATPVCDPEIDELLQAARDAQIPAQRYALISQAAAKIDDQALFLPIAAPVRWALVGGRIPSFAGNRFARHSLVGLSRDAAGKE